VTAAGNGPAPRAIVAPTVLALLSAEATWTTGNVVHVDGGYTR
jgi:NAD(P)-dependent dehydrogenase (short-subunit alcohol dehydrogenase family)